jgi:Ser/Thr protein kinase RdoA (MazF antagonist)
MGNQRIRIKKQLNKKDLLNIKFNYGVDIKSQVPFSQGMRSNTLFVETSLGKRVIKIYPNNFSFNLIEFQARACNHMNNCGVPTPRIFSNRDNSFTTPIEDTNYVVMEHRDGRSLSEKGFNVANYNLEAIAISLDSLASFEVDKLYEAPEIEISLEDQFKELQINLGKKGKKNVDPLVWNYQNKLSEIYDNLKKGLEEHESSKQLILGDFNSGSLLVNDGAISGILDFDNIQYQLKSYDFMHFFDIFYVDKESANISLEERVNWDALEKCIEIYSNFDSEIKEHIESFPFAYQLLGFRNLIDVWGNYYAGRSDSDYFEEKKFHYLPRVEIPFLFGDKILEVLQNGLF